MRKQSSSWKNGCSKENLSGKGERKSKINWKNLREKAEKCRSKKDCPVFAEMERQSRERVEKRKTEKPSHQEKLVGKEILPELTPLQRPKEIFPKFAPLSKLSEDLPQLTPLPKLKENHPPLTTVQGPKEVLPQLTSVQKVKEDLPQLTLPRPPFVSSTAKESKTPEVSQQAPHKSAAGAVKSQPTPKPTPSQSAHPQKKSSVLEIIVALSLVRLFLALFVGVLTYYHLQQQKEQTAELASISQVTAQNEPVVALPAPVPVQNPASSAFVTSVVEESGENLQSQNIEIEEDSDLSQEEPPQIKVLHMRKKKKRVKANNYEPSRIVGVVNEADSENNIASSSRWNIVKSTCLCEDNMLVVDYKYSLPNEITVEVSAVTPDGWHSLIRQVGNTNISGRRLTIYLPNSFPQGTKFSVSYWQ